MDNQSETYNHGNPTPQADGDHPERTSAMISKKTVQAALPIRQRFCSNRSLSQARLLLEPKH